MTVSKVKQITPDGSFETSNGKFFSFKYQFEDGTELQANHKSESSPFNVGDEAEYEVTKEDPQYGKRGKVKKVGSSQFNGAKTYSKGGNNRSFALSYAKDIAVAIIRDGKSISDNDILETADKFVAWLDGKSTTVKEQLEETAPQGDKLPF